MADRQTDRLNGWLSGSGAPVDRSSSPVSTTFRAQGVQRGPRTGCAIP